MEGDALIGRKTVPIIYPSLAAPALAVAILAWSTFLVVLWQVSYATVFLFGGLAAFTALSYLMSNSVLGFQRAFYLYKRKIRSIVPPFSTLTYYRHGLLSLTACPCSKPWAYTQLTSECT